MEQGEPSTSSTLRSTMAFMSAKDSPPRGKCGLRRGIKASVQCDGGRFENAAPAMPDGNLPWTPHAATALDLRAAKIDRNPFLGANSRRRVCTRRRVRLGQSPGLSRASDHRSSKLLAFEENKISRRKLPAFIFLDGFTYDRLAGRGDYAGKDAKKMAGPASPPSISGVNFSPSAL